MQVNDAMKHLAVRFAMFLQSNGLHPISDDDIQSVRDMPASRVTKYVLATKELCLYADVEDAIAEQNYQLLRTSLPSKMQHYLPGTVIFDDNDTEVQFWKFGSALITLLKIE